MKALVAGWFSFVDGHATAGDLLVRDVVCGWLEQIGLAYDVAHATPISGGVDWRVADPDEFSHVLFVCGPFQRSAHECEFLQRFARCRLVGLNLSMGEPTLKWNPFDLLLERDSSERSRADLAFLSPAARVPVVGVCLVEDHPGALVNEANDAFSRLINSREMATVKISTRLDVDSHNPLRTPAEIESLIGCTDVLLTTRLHGLVLALKHGIPPIAIDPVPGGAKIYRQAKLLGWPYTFLADRLDERALQDAFEHCLTQASRVKARECAERARELLRDTIDTFFKEIPVGRSMEESYEERMISTERLCSPEEPAQGSPRSWRQKLRDSWIRVQDRLGITKT